MAPNEPRTNAIPDRIRYDGEIVISGISGKFPASRDVNELWDNLCNKVDMMGASDGIHNRMPLEFMDVGNYGKIYDTEKFDNEFFRVNPEASNWMTPESRMCMELAYEAIVDAGHSIESMAGRNTGTFYSHGAIFEAPHSFPNNPDNMSSHSFIGLVTSMLPNRVAHYFDLRGRSVVVDSACSSSLSAFDLAIEAIRNGTIDSALVGGAGCTFGPQIGMELKKFGVASSNGRCKVFDSSADGYGRSDAAGTIFLEKKAQARRCYAKVVETGSGHDGKTSSVFGATSTVTQHELIKDVLKRSGVDHREIDFVETHGTGTQVGDPNEVKALDIDGLLTKDRKHPLMIGSIKSNLGHSECLSGLPSLTKAVMIMHHDNIPPNLNYSFETTNPKIDSILEGRVVVPTENTPYRGGLVAINSFGIGGSIAHILLAPPDTKKKSLSPAGKAPRLFTYAGRCEEGLTEVLGFAKKHQTVIEVQQLMASSANMVPSLMPYRGYTVLNASSELQEVQTTLPKKPPVWFVFPGLGCQWLKMGQDLMNIPVARQSMEKNCKAFYKETGYDIMEFFKGGPKAQELLDTLPMPLVMTVEVALVDILKAVGIEPDGIVGHSNGEVCSAYADGCITGEEAVFMAYLKSAMKFYGKDIPIYEGIMATVGMSVKECSKRCPPSVKVVCHNAEELVTVTGLATDVKAMVKKLNDEGKFAKLIPTNGLPYHHPDMAKYMDRQRQVAKNVLNSPKPRSSRWICTSYPEDQWDCPGANIADKEYFMNNSISPVYFHEAVQKIPKDALIIEIGPHPLFSSLIQKTLGSGVKMISLMKRDHEDCVGLCLAAIGKCYMYGIDVQPLNLHPPASFPVPSDVPVISPAIRKSWDHSDNFRIPLHTEFFENKSADEFKVSQANGSEFEFLKEHKVDGQVLFPASGFIYLAWKALAKQLGVKFTVLPIRVEGAEFNKSVVIPEKGDIVFAVSVLGTTGYFEITLDDELVAKGNIKKATDTDTSMLKSGSPASDEASIKLDSAGPDLVKGNVCTLQRVRGYQYLGLFNSIARASLDCNQYVIESQGQWVAYLNAVMQACDFSRQSKTMCKPTSFDVVIDPTMVTMIPKEIKYSKLEVNKKTGEAETCGVKFSKVKFVDVCRKPVKPGHYDEQQFFPFVSNKQNEDVRKYSQQCQALAKELISLSKGVNGSVPTSKTSQQSIVSNDFSPMSSEEDTGLAQLLKTFCNSYREDPTGDKADLYDPEVLQDDKLLASSCSAPIMKQCLDLADANVSDKTIKLLDIGEHSLDRFKLIKAFEKHEPCTDYAYSACSSYLEKYNSAPKSLNVVSWNLGELLSLTDKYDMIIASNILHKQTSIKDSLEQMSSLLAPGGFLQVREVTQNMEIAEAMDIMNPETDGNTSGTRKSSEEWKKIFDSNGYELIMENAGTELATMFFLRKRVSKTVEPVVINVDDFKCSWLDKVQKSLPKKDGTNANVKIWLVSTNPITGVNGMMKVLRNERLSDNVRCAFVSNLNSKSPVPDLSPKGAVFKKILAQDLSINMCRDGQWGSTYRLPSTYEQTFSKSEDASLQQLFWGDMSSLTWAQNEIPTNTSSKETLVSHYIGLNECDLAFLNGKVSAVDLGLRSNIIGFDVAGKLKSGRRVMALTPSAASTLIDTSDAMLFDVPDTWSFEEASTVPSAYATAVYALVVKGNVRKGDAVLVHSGMSHVGQAALHLALNMGCDVYTTVESEAETFEILGNITGVKKTQIALRTDSQFVKAFTKDMNVIINTIPGDHMDCSIRMLAPYGKFIDVMSLPNQQAAKIDLSSLPREATYNTANIYQLLKDTSDMATSIKQQVQGHMATFIKANAVVPLSYNVFESNEIEDAIESLASEDDDRKVIIELQEEVTTSNGPKESTVLALNRTLFKPSHSYVIMGGLGGFGLEMARWMVTKGCRKLVLSSRSGLKTGLQHYCVNEMRREGCQVVVSGNNAVTLKGADDLLKDAVAMGPLGGVFNLSVVLQDKILKNQSVDKFHEVFSPKIHATLNLDKLTREKYRDTVHLFVVFSSQAAAQGIPGQSNYAFANSSCEKMCEMRRNDGLHGQAIQWGNVGDVGFVASLTDKLTGLIEQYIPQKIVSCLDAINILLQQPAPVAGSFSVPGDEIDEVELEDDEEGDGEEESLIAIVGNMLGLRSTANLEDSMTLRELGIDSFMTSEVKDLLEDDFGLEFSDEEVRSLSVGKLRSIEK